MCLDVEIANFLNSRCNQIKVTQQLLGQYCFINRNQSFVQYSLFLCSKFTSIVNQVTISRPTTPDDFRSKHKQPIRFQHYSKVRYKPAYFQMGMLRVNHEFIDQRLITVQYQTQHILTKTPPFVKLTNIIQYQATLYPNHQYRI